MTFLKSLASKRLAVTTAASAFIATLPLIALLLAGCGASQQEAKTAAACAATRGMFDTAQTELIGAGLCDEYTSVSLCPAHIALREALVTATKELKCPP